MRNWRKWLNAFLVVVLIILFIAIVIEFCKMMSIQKRRVEEANNKPEYIEQEGENEISSESEDGRDSFNDVKDNLLLDYNPISVEDFPAFSGKPYVEIDGGMPDFSDDDLNTQSFEHYSQLDYLGRCGVATANISMDMMPTEPRGNIGHIKPSGWHTVKYPELISDRYLYNRCHLIAYSLCGENDNEQNLITGTRYMNTQGMLRFENDVLNYIEHTNNHVLYRVTPYFIEKELVARGVQIEAFSVEDNGKGICINVYVYNVQPGICIDYATGDSWIEEEKSRE